MASPFNLNIVIRAVAGPKRGSASDRLTLLNPAEDELRDGQDQ